jgi:hypothetical protein
MVLRLSSMAFMAIAILFLCLATFANAENTRQLHGSRARNHRRANVISKLATHPSSSSPDALVKETSY